MEDQKKNYPYEYTFLTSREPLDNSPEIFRIEFRVASKFINIPFYKKGVGVSKLIPFKDSLPFKLTDDNGNSYRVNKEMYSASDIGDFAVLEYKSKKDFQIPIRMTIYKARQYDEK